MKKLHLAALGLVGLLLGQVAGAQNYGMGGCGLGSMVITGSNSFEQVFVLLTNHWTGSQTSGITSGTSNCRDDAKSTANLFFEINKDALQRDVARGEGETLVSLAQILGCGQAEPLASNLQRHYSEVFMPQGQGARFMDAVEPLLLADSSIQCSAI